MSHVSPAVPASVTLADIGPLGEKLSTGAGESVGIHWLSGDLQESGLLFKQYKKKASASDGRTAALDRLVAFGRDTSAAWRADREILLGSTSWPAAKVTDEFGTMVGCLIPEAGQKFRKANGDVREIDVLAQPDDELDALGESVTSEQRRAACRSLVRVAAALDSQKLVYSDWNYANALWCPDDSSVFVIDIDGCRLHQMPNIYQTNWEDRLTRHDQPADTFTDRYRVALLTARCLTGERKLAPLLHRLDASGDPVLRYLLDMLWAESRDKRPDAQGLVSLLDRPDFHFRYVVRRRALPEPSSQPVTWVQYPAPSPSVPPVQDGGATPSAKPDNHGAAWRRLAIALVLLVVVVIAVLAAFS